MRLGTVAEVNETRARGVVAVHATAEGAPKIVAFEGLSVLYLEDEALIALYGEEMLKDLGFARVAVAYDETSALALVERERFNVGVLDLNLGRGGDSLDVARRLRDQGARIVFCSGYVEPGPAVDGLQAVVLTKPITDADLHRALETALS